jgi:hypothetical protein
VAKTIGACGHPVGDKRIKRCRACWKGRGPDGATPHPICKICNVKPVGRLRSKTCVDCYHSRRKEAIGVTVAADNAADAIRKMLSGGAKSLEELSRMLDKTQGQTLDALIAMRGHGVNLHEMAGKWSLERIPHVVEKTFEYVSRPDNTFHFGISSDQHLGSRYARLDVLDDLYNAFEASKVDRVFNAGNWIDGEDEKNRFDLEVHGLEPQIDYLVDRYPNRGITTYTVTGEDHEGWFSRRESIDVGRFAERKMRDAGRTDWVDMGFIEARVDLVNANTGARNSLVVMHPGGGSSYAYSYRPQKIVESLSGGEKPGVLVIGHYHKLDCRPIRNIWTIQAGCSQDQTVFMRKKGLDAQVGGMIVTLEQDQETGAIFRCVSDSRIYYDRHYYNGRWSSTNSVVQSPRFLGGVRPLAS